jgi:predicted nucleotidyltransferase
MAPTPFPELNHVLEQLVKAQKAVLGDNLVAVYLQGSFALGDADEHSDVDFISVLHRELSTKELADLQQMHAHIHDIETGWAKHLEGSYFPAAHLRSREDKAKELAYLDNGASRLVFSDHCDTAVVRWTTREYGIPLLGPGPKTLIDSVPPEALREEVKGLFATWVQPMIDRPETIDSAWYQAFAVVMICRMLQTLATGRVHSKKASVAWALANLDPRWHPLIERAWSQRPRTYEIVPLPPAPHEQREIIAFLRAAQA